MNTNLFHPALFNPLMVWTDLAMKTTDMVVSSGQEIGSRVDQMARASANPNPRDMNELTQASSEKVKVATESGLDMITRLQSANYRLVAQAWQQWFASLAAMTALVGSRSFGETLSRQDRLFNSLHRSNRAQLPLASDTETETATTAHARRPARVSRTRAPARRRGTRKD